jgi:signal transduction histidine kinase
MSFFRIHRRSIVIGSIFFALIGALLTGAHFSLEKWRNDVIRSNTSLAVVVAEELHAASVAVMDSLVRSGTLATPLQSIDAKQDLDACLKRLSDSAFTPVMGMEGGFYLTYFEEFFGYSYPTSPPPVPVYGPPPRSYELIKGQVRQTIETGKRKVDLLAFDPAVFPLVTEPVQIDGRVVAVVWARTHIEREFPAAKLREAINISALVALLGFGIALVISVTQYREIQRMRRDLERVQNGQAENIEEGKGTLGVIASAINIMLGTMRLDNSRREQLERELHQKEKMASLGRVIAAVAHEVKTPLAIIKTRIQMWQHSLRESPQPGQERTVISDDSLQLVVTEVDRLADLVKRLLVFSKPQPLHLEPTDITAVLKQTISLIEMRGRKRTVEVICNLAENMPPVRADRSALLQVFMNVLVNSYESIQGTGTITVTTEHDADAKLCRVTIHDTGIGIPEELRLKVFDPFVTTKKKGFGLGLSISYEIVVTHGGSIQLYPHETVGTACVIEFPIQPARDAKL